MGAGGRVRRRTERAATGAGESGKSTVAKQMQIIHADEGGAPFTDQEVREYVPVIYANVLQSLVAVLDYMASHGLKLRSKARVRCAGPGPAPCLHSHSAPLFSFFFFFFFISLFWPFFF